MTNREALLACYLSGQMSAAQWERHCEDDPELRKMVEAPRAMTDPIAAMRAALGILCDEIEATEEHGAAAFENFCPVCKAIERARAARAAYDAAVAPVANEEAEYTKLPPNWLIEELSDCNTQIPRQSADVEEMARTIADIWGPAGERREYLYSDLLSFAARVAADQREKDAKIAETPDQQRANKTAAQIAAAIRTQGESE